MKTYRVGIIGCGGIANGKHMPSLASVPNVEMVAFCDIVLERAEAAAQKFGTEDAKVYTDYRDLVARDDIDIVHVCTPNSNHCEISVAAMESGKHVMCEKPMALNYADARKMVEVSKKTGKKLSIGYRSQPERIPAGSPLGEKRVSGRHLLCSRRACAAGVSRPGAFLRL